MDKTMETKFFEAFKWGGVVDKCIDWIRYTYNLPPTKPRASTEEREKTPEQEQAKEKWDKYYREILPKKILEATEAFDDSVIRYMDSPLMDEIEANLNDCKTDTQRDRYLFSLLKPFGEKPRGCGIARVYMPTAEQNRLEEEIKDCEKDKAYWETLPEDEQLKNVNGEPAGTPKGQVDACNDMCKRYQEQIDWVLYVNHQFIDLTCTDKDKEGSVEQCLGAFVRVMERFADRLDALLLTYGIDLMRLQRESGLYLKKCRLIDVVSSYIGSMELAQKYIEALQKEPQPRASTGNPKPTRGRGRPKEALKYKMIDDAKGEKLQKIHKKMNGKKGKDAALIILACIKIGWTTRPTYAQVAKEFGDIGSRQCFNKYLNDKMFTKEEMEGAIKSLD